MFWLIPKIHADAIWSAGDQRKADGLKAARAESARLSAVGAPIHEQLRASALESALEAEMVTGLKPVSFAGRRGRGGRGRGRGRGAG